MRCRKIAEKRAESFDNLFVESELMKTKLKFSEEKLQKVEESLIETKEKNSHQENEIIMKIKEIKPEIFENNFKETIFKFIKEYCFKSSNIISLKQQVCELNETCEFKIGENKETAEKLCRRNKELDVLREDITNIMESFKLLQNKHNETLNKLNEAFILNKTIVKEKNENMRDLNQKIDESSDKIQSLTQTNLVSLKLKLFFFLFFKCFNFFNNFFICFKKFRILKQKLPPSNQLYYSKRIWKRNSLKR